MARNRTTDYELEKLLYLRRIEAVDHHLNFMQYTWQNHSEPFTIGYHTRKICAAIDYAMELYRDGKSSAWVITVPFRHGKALEVNTSALRGKLNMILPPVRYLRMFHELGGANSISIRPAPLDTATIHYSLFTIH